MINDSGDLAENAGSDSDDVGEVHSLWREHMHIFLNHQPSTITEFIILNVLSDKMFLKV